MLNLEQLFKALQAGELESARKELTRYGTIIKTEDFEDLTGARRLQVIAHFANRYHLEMHNGRVLSISANGEIYHQKDL